MQSSVRPVNESAGEIGVTVVGSATSVGEMGGRPPRGPSQRRLRGSAAYVEVTARATSDHRARAPGSRVQSSPAK